MLILHTNPINTSLSIFINVYIAPTHSSIVDPSSRFNPNKPHQTIVVPSARFNHKEPRSRRAQYQNIYRLRFRDRRKRCLVGTRGGFRVGWEEKGVKGERREKKKGDKGNETGS